MITAYQVIVSGRVQGVGYRAWAMREAAQHKLTGWVRNLTSGQVEAFLQGNELAIGQVISAMKVGPSGARVTSVEKMPQQIDPELDSFEIRK